MKQSTELMLEIAKAIDRFNADNPKLKISVIRQALDRISAAIAPACVCVESK